jgi:hypothetical protein
MIYTIEKGAIKMTKKGWTGESQRHRLARNGIKTGKKLGKVYSPKNVKISQVMVNREYYKRETGKYPTGYGTWVFQIGKNQTNTFTHLGNYTDAKKLAVEKAIENGEYTVRVLS